MLALHLFPCLLFRRGAAPFPGPPKSLPQRSSSCAPAPCLPEHKITCSPYTYSPAYCSGQELRHFLALLRAYPSAAAAVPQLPSPLCVHPATLLPGSGIMGLPKVGCGSCGVCRWVQEFEVIAIVLLACVHASVLSLPPDSIGIMRSWVRQLKGVQLGARV